MILKRFGLHKLVRCRSDCKSGNYREIAAIGITNQRETTIVWDRETNLYTMPGKIVEQKYCDELKAGLC
jgi:glycerol kinase